MSLAGEMRSTDSNGATLSTYASPVVGTLPVQAVDLTLVMKVLEPIWHDQT